MRASSVNPMVEDGGWRVARPRVAACATLHPLSSILVFSSLALCPLPGCALPGVVAHKLVGPPPVPAQYVPRQEPLLVLVENYHNPAAAAVEAQHLALRIEEEIRRYRIAPVVGADRLEAVRNDPGYAKMTIPAVARAAGARQVLYVNVGTFAVDRTVGGDMLQGRAEMTVRIVGAATGVTRWPTDNPTGYPIPIETPWLRAGADTTEADLRDTMARQAATQIGLLFRKHGVE
jgi:hypothetical protein